jgi:hypothetical protein
MENKEQGVMLMVTLLRNQVHESAKLRQTHRIYRTQPDTSSASFALTTFFIICYLSTISYFFSTLARSENINRIRRETLFDAIPYQFLGCRTIPLLFKTEPSRSVPTAFLIFCDNALVHNLMNPRRGPENVVKF